MVEATRKVMADPKLQAFLKLPDSFSSPDGLDAAMVKCAVMRAAARGDSRGHESQMLAQFALQGAEEEALVEDD